MRCWGWKTECMLAEEEGVSTRLASEWESDVSEFLADSLVSGSVVRRRRMPDTAYEMG